jgi:hypothetical protein
MPDVVPYDDIIRQGMVGSKFFACQKEALMTMVY